jgi:serine/threonine-protein kinase
LGPYKLVKELGRGGMGIVFQAWDPRHRRMVALKILQSGARASLSDLRRFQTEAQALAQLAHPNIVRVHEVGRSGDLCFLSMQLVRGSTLAVLCADCAERDTRWLRQAAVWMISLAHAVHYAHQQGVLHRDLKPGNILVDTHGASYLTDFGLAKCDGRASLTGSHRTMGTPQYASPEQLDGRARATPASDVYGLGAVLYELLTGRPPFAGDNPLTTARQVLETEPILPQALNPQVDGDLSTVCLTCLRKDPTRRYESAEAVAADLERWLGYQPIRARPVTPFERAAGCIRRNPFASLLTGILALELVIGAGVMRLWVNADPKPPQSSLAGAAPVTPLQCFGPDACPLSVKRLPGGRLEVWSIDLSQRIQVLPGSCYTAVAFTPDNRYLVAARADALEVWDVTTWERVPRVDTLPGR